MPQRVLSESEYNAVKDRVLSALPPNLSEADFNRVIGSAMEQALGEAENTPATPEGSAVSRYASGVGEMLNPITMAQGVYQAVRHPIETVTGQVSAMGDQWSKAKDAAAAGRYTEAAARAVTGSVPIAGPLVASIGEQAGEGDLAGAAGKLTGLAVPFAAEKALTARTASRAATKAPLLERAATQQVAERVLAPGNPAFRGRAQKIAPEMMARKMTGGRVELQQAAEEGMADAAARIDEAIQAAGGVGARVPTQEVISDLRQTVADLKDSAGKPLSERAAKRIQAIEQRIYQVKSLGGRTGTVTYEDLRKIRDENYDIAAEARAYERQGNPIKSDEGWAARESGGAIRSTFAKRSPATAAANADYAFFKTLHDVLDPAIGRPKAQAPPAGVTGGARTTGAVAGAMMGSKSAAFVLSVVVPWIKTKMSDASWQLADAQRKMELAQAMKRGDIGRMQSVMVQIGKVGPTATSPSGRQTGATPALETP